MVDAAWLEKVVSVETSDTRVLMIWTFPVGMPVFPPIVLVRNE